MLRLETDPLEIAFAVQDTSELLVVHRAVSELEGGEELKARVSATLAKVISREMIPEQDPFYGSEAELIFAQLQRIAHDGKLQDSKAAEQMVWEYRVADIRPYVLGLQRQHEAELIAAGEPAWMDKVVASRSFDFTEQHSERMDKEELQVELFKD